MGARRDRRRLARCLGQGPWAGLPVVGFVDAGHPRYSGRLGRGRHLAVHPQTDPVPVLGGIDRLDELVDRSRATHVVVAVSGRPAKRLRPRIGSPAQLRRRRPLGRPTDAARRGRRTTRPTPTGRPLGPPGRWRWDRLAKRVVDFVGRRGSACSSSRPCSLVVVAR